MDYTDRRQTTVTDRNAEAWPVSKSRELLNPHPLLPSRRNVACPEGPRAEKSISRSYAEIRDVGTYLFTGKVRTKEGGERFRFDHDVLARFQNTIIEAAVSYIHGG